MLREHAGFCGTLLRGLQGTEVDARSPLLTRIRRIQKEHCCPVFFLFLLHLQASGTYDQQITTTLRLDSTACLVPQPEAHKVQLQDKLFPIIVPIITWYFLFKYLS